MASRRLAPAATLRRGSSASSTLGRYPRTTTPRPRLGVGALSTVALSARAPRARAVCPRSAARSFVASCCAIGRTLRAHRGAVAASSPARHGSNRHWPSSRSASSQLVNTCCARNLSRKASTAGRTGSITSNTRESRHRSSACKRPSTGSRPAARTAIRASASRMA